MTNLEKKQKFRTLERKFGAQASDHIIEVIDSTMSDFKTYIDHKFDTIDHKFDTINHKFDTIDHKFEAKFESLEKRFSQITWLIAVAFTTLTILIATFKFLG